MRCKMRKLIAIFLLGLGFTGLQAQNAITATGGDASGSGGSVSFTIGQIAYNTATNSNGSVAQGVQQAYEISEVSGLIESKGITLQCSVFPNPTSDFLTLKIEDEMQIQYLVSLIDINGKMLVCKKTEGFETIISMKNLVPAVYFLKITQNDNEVKTFKIIKN